MATSAERGFTLIEAATTMFLTTLVIGGIFDATLLVSAHSARPMQDSALTTIAQNIASDLRASVAYYSPAAQDPNPLRALYGTMTPRDVQMATALGSPTPTVTVHCVTTIPFPAGPSPDPTPNAAAPVEASIHCTNPATGSDVTVNTWLYNQAPIPGSTLQADVPATQ